MTALNEPRSVYEFDVTCGHDSPEMTCRWGCREALINDIPIPTPSQPYAFIKYCISGGGLLEDKDDCWRVNAGMVCWGASKHANTLTADPGGMENFAIFMGGKKGLELFQEALSAPMGAFKLQDANAIEQIFTSIMQEGLSTDQHREENCVSLTRVLLRRIQRQQNNLSLGNASARQTFSRCREFIARNFIQLGSLGEVSDRCGITVPYLCRLFEQFSNCSPYDYMTRLKMGRAENLLLRPHSYIRDVAVAVGYKDARLFSRNFKAQYGKTPRQYRCVNAVTVDD